MTDYQTCWTNPHLEIDPLMRIRVLERQLATVADAVRILAQAVEGTTGPAGPAGIAKQIEDLLHETHVPHQ